MSEHTIRIPSWALPIVAAILSGAIAWGAADARAEATAKDVKRIEAVVQKTVAEQQDTGKLAAVNATKIEAIVDSLANKPRPPKRATRSYNNL